MKDPLKDKNVMLSLAMITFFVIVTFMVTFFAQRPQISRTRAAPVGWSGY